MEDTLAKELQLRKNEEEKQRLYRQKICDESEEIQTLKKKLQMAYVNKERTQQILEWQQRKLEDLVEMGIL